MTKPNLLSEEQFREAAKAGTVEDARLRKAFIAEVKAADDGDRKLDFVISTATIDRMGDTISVDGWQLGNYRKNPVVLWAHDSSAMPVAKAMNVRAEDGKLKATAEFMPVEMSPFADSVFRALKGGFLSAVSVGFAPLKYAFSDEPGRSFGIDFLDQELLEFSVCPVPANPEALIEARAAGIDIVPIRDWAVKLLAGENLSLIDVTRLAAITALPEELRGDAKKAAGSKGASGLYRRCANRIERALNGGEPPADPDETQPEPAVKPASPRFNAIAEKIRTLPAYDPDGDGDNDAEEALGMINAAAVLLEEAADCLSGAPDSDDGADESKTGDVAAGFSDIAARRLVTLRNKAA